VAETFRSLRGAFAYIIPHWRRLSLVVAVSLISTATSLAIPYLTRKFVDEALLGRDLRALSRIVFTFAALAVAGFMLNVVSGLRYTRVSADILFDMRLALYRHLQRLSPRFYARTRLGDIVSRLNNDIGEIQRVASEAALAWLGNVAFLIGTIVMLVWLDVRLFAASIMTLPLAVWMLVRYRRRLEVEVASLRSRSSEIGSFLIETLQGVRLVETSNAAPREVARFRRLNDRFIGSLMSMQRASYLSGGVPGLVLSIGTAVVFLYGGSRVIAGATTLGTFAAFMAYQMRLMAPVQSLMGLYASLVTVRVSWRRVAEILDVPPDVVEARDPRSIDRASGEIEFDRVTVSMDRPSPVLDGVSFRARPGEVVAIVGASGSGKSTIAFLLARLLDPDRGAVRLDGLDLRELRLADVRRSIALVEQEPYLFHASIAENLRYARPEASDDQIRRAAADAGIADFIEALPSGYDTIVGERGHALSVGERQRIAIARAFLADPAVLVLDEPTSALDPVTERLVVEGYQTVMRTRTTILISHRLELACRADRVLVMQDARVVEQGAPRDLAARDGAFAALFGVEAEMTSGVFLRKV
jgi:ATP-binding cassette, subfamily B, bacterial